MKKWEISLASGVAIAVLLSACGGGTPVKTDAASKPAAKAAMPKMASAKPKANEPASAVQANKPPAASVNKPVAASSGTGRFAGTAAAHNKIRARHNLSELSWSDSLASYAGVWADQLAAKGCQMEHRPNSGTFKQEHGENLYWAGATQWSDGRREVQNVSIDAVVNDWASEVKDYNYASNSCAPGKQCGHYTQIVWKDTTAVGCAYKQCGDSSQIWVCNYSPAGNIVGQKPY